MLPRLVRRELLPAANSLGQISQNTALTGGPLLAGVIVGSLGFSYAYGVDALSFVAILYALVRLPPAPPDGAVPRAGLQVGRWRDLRFLGPRKNLLMTFLVDINAMVFGMPRALFPALADRHLPRRRGDRRPALRRAVGRCAARRGVSGWSGRVRRQGLAVLVSIAVGGRRSRCSGSSTCCGSGS